jgi:predicted nucleic acid-binding protein
VRVLLDVNILVRANEKSQGPARRLLLDLIARKHVILTSADMSMGP